LHVISQVHLVLASVAALCNQIMGKYSTW